MAPYALTLLEEELANDKNSTKVAGKSTSSVPQLSVVQLDGHLMFPPLFYAGGNLGFEFDGEGPLSMSIVDETGQSFRIQSLEWVLRYIDSFYAACSMTLLAGAAAHYGFTDPNILIKGRMQ
jgi:hypothetical protein